MRTGLIALILTLATAAAFAANPVLVDSAGSGDFTTIQAAISSWCAGGSNASEPPPFVINIKAGSGPYDEALSLDEAQVGLGNIVGDITIKSDTPGTKVILKLQPNGGTLGADDGLMISQPQYNCTFRDLVFTRSFSNPCTDEIVRSDEAAANATVNTLAFYNCVFTEVDASGNPMTTDKAGALLPPPANGITTLSANPRLLQVFGDPGESISVILEDCVFYAGKNINCIVRLEGTLGTGAGNGYAETCQITNCISSYAFGDCFNIGGQNQAAVFTVTGTDQKAGPLSCTAGLYPAYKGATANNGHCFTLSASGGAAAVDSNTINISKVIAYAPADSSGTTGSSTQARGITGGSSVLTIEDAIISVPLYGTADITRKPVTWNRLTIHSNGAGNNAYLAASASVGEGTLTINDSIFSGPGTKFGTLGAWPAGGIILNNCALPTSGLYAIGAVGGGASVTQNNCITDDPDFASLDGLVEDFADVRGAAYATAGTGGVALAGGADYEASDINDWFMF